MLLFCRLGFRKYDTSKKVYFIFKKGSKKGIYATWSPVKYNNTQMKVTFGRLSRRGRGERQRGRERVLIIAIRWCREGKPDTFIQLNFYRWITWIFLMTYKRPKVDAFILYSSIYPQVLAGRKECQCFTLLVGSLSGSKSTTTNRVKLH